MGLTIGLLSLSPSFDSKVTDYTATTNNASNKITTIADEDAEVSISVNGNIIENGTTASWKVGTNTVTINVKKPGIVSGQYNVIVTKS